VSTPAAGTAQAGAPSMANSAAMSVQDAPTNVAALTSDTKDAAAPQTDDAAAADTDAQKKAAAAGKKHRGSSDFKKRLFGGFHGFDRMLRHLFSARNSPSSY
jgi:hypothetical protein